MRRDEPPGAARTRTRVSGTAANARTGKYGPARPRSRKRSGEGAVGTRFFGSVPLRHHPAERRELPDHSRPDLRHCLPRRGLRLRRHQQVRCLHPRERGAAREWEELMDEWQPGKGFEALASNGHTGMYALGRERSWVSGVAVNAVQGCTAGLTAKPGGAAGSVALRARAGSAHVAGSAVGQVADATRNLVGR